MLRWIISVLLIAGAQVATAATITVNTTADNLTGADGWCTLREAIANVNAATDTTAGDCASGTGAGDTLTFNLKLPAKIKLVLGELVVQHDVDISGPTAGLLRVNGAHASRIFRIAGATVVVSDLIIEQGSSYTGGAILNLGMTTLRNCTLRSNRARGWGGAIANSGGTMALTNCTVTGNRATGGGGGIDNGNAGTMTLTNCTLSGNKSIRRSVEDPGGQLGGGISNVGTMTLINSTLRGNRGSQAGGIANSMASSPGTMTLVNCTLTGNYARWGAGGAIQNQGAMTLTNCTISRNKAWNGPGSLGGGGIWYDNYDPRWVTTLTNTIVAGNGKARDCGGQPVTSAGHNLDSDGTCFTSGGTDLVSTDPMLAPLANYGGATATFALCSGAGVPRRSCKGANPAIDAGDDAVTGPPLSLTTDQRGLPRLSGAHVDIGAYEAQ
jgi:CSLREA domain-containing protein